MSKNDLKPENVFTSWDWSDVEPLYESLAHQSINSHNLPGWLSEWTSWHNLLEETHNRCYVATTCHTDDIQARQKYQRYLQEIYPEAEQAEQRLKEHLLASGETLPGIENPLRNIRAEAGLYCAENVPLLSNEKELITHYDEILSNQTILWKGVEIPIPQIQPILQAPKRTEREAAWRSASQRQLQDREQINELWCQFYDLRRSLAINKGMENYRAYRWQQLLRLDYSVQDCYRFHSAIEKVVLPAAKRVFERRRQKMGLPSIRPWDNQADPLNRPRLQPCQNSIELRDGCGRILQQINPQLGEYFDILCKGELLDLENRKGKAPGGYCIEFSLSKLPFIFMNAVGIHDDVLTLVHESGHAFHAFEQFKLPYHLQYACNLEFMEVASTTMEYLSSPYLASENGGFYSAQDAARAVVERLESLLLFLPYMAVVDVFQHRVYENPRLAENPAELDSIWAAQWQRFMPHEDWSGLEEEMKTGWQRKLHIFEDPFYYIEYGLAELGAVQIWMNSLQNQAKAIQSYLTALSLGSTVNINQQYQTARASLIWDEEPLARIITFLENKIEELSSVAEG